jgi:hypothetical protein
MLKFRQLSEEISRARTSAVQGFHDFEKPNIMGEATQHLFVVAHENIHDEIIFKTPFGGFQLLCNELASLNLSNLSLNPSPDGLFDFLCDNSELAHEAAATYLSITQMPQSSHQKILEIHPDKYREYYSLLSNPVHLIANSSYIRYIFA